MADDLQTIVQRMIDAGEPEENIATVIQSQATATPKTWGQGAQELGSGVLRGATNVLNPMSYLRTWRDKTAAEDRQVAELKGEAQPSTDYGMSNVKAIGRTLATPSGAGEMLGGLATGYLLPKVAGLAGGVLRTAAPKAMEMGLNRTVAQKIEYPNVAQRLVDERIIPRGTNVQDALKATEAKVSSDASAFDAAHPINPVDPDKIAQAAHDSAYKTGRLGGLGDQPGPEAKELDQLHQQYLDQNTRSRSLSETIAQKRANQQRVNYSNKPQAKPSSSEEQNFNRGLASANRDEAIRLHPPLEADLAKERDLIGADVAQQYADVKGTPHTAVGVMKTITGLRNPTVMGGGAIGLDLLGQGLQAPSLSAAMRAAILSLLAQPRSQQQPEAR